MPNFAQDHQVIGVSHQDRSPLDLFIDRPHQCLQVKAGQQRRITPPRGVPLVVGLIRWVLFRVFLLHRSSQPTLDQLQNNAPLIRRATNRWSLAE